MYGVRFHPAADREDTKINLSVSHMGLQVFQVTAAFVMTPCPFDLLKKKKKKAFSLFLM